MFAVEVKKEAVNIECRNKQEEMLENVGLTNIGE
jgi:hypothetical protein